MKDCIIHYTALLANICLIIFALYIFVDARGMDKYLAMLFLIPPVFSICALARLGDREERTLRKSIRKAELRKALNDLKDYTA